MGDLWNTSLSCISWRWYPQYLGGVKHWILGTFTNPRNCGETWIHNTPSWPQVTIPKWLAVFRLLRMWSQAVHRDPTVQRRYPKRGVMCPYFSWILRICVSLPISHPFFNGDVLKSGNPQSSNHPKNWTILYILGIETYVFGYPILGQPPWPWSHDLNAPRFSTTRAWLWRNPQALGVLSTKRTRRGSRTWVRWVPRCGMIMNEFRMIYDDFWGFS